MHAKTKVIVLGALAGLVVGFGAGYFVPHGAPAQAKGQFAQFAGRAGAAGRMGGVTAGQIIAKDSSSITVKMTDGSTKIVLISTSTPILKTAAGSASDLSVGTEVVVSGSTNSDGSVTAQSVQLRPAGSNALMMRYQGATQ